jgi:hypothetical protein
VLICAIILEDRAAAQTPVPFGFPSPNPACAHQVAPGSTVNTVASTVVDPSGHVASFAACPAPAQQAAAGAQTGAAAADPLSNPVHVEALDYLSDRGNGASDVGTWNRVDSQFEIPSYPTTGLPSASFRISSGILANENPGSLVRVVVLYGPSAEFNITQQGAYFVTVAYEAFSASVSNAVYYTTPRRVYPGDWITASLRIVRADAVAMYGTEFLWDLSYSVNRETTSTSLSLYLNGGANHPSFDFGFLGAVDSDPIQSCTQLPLSGQMFFRSSIWYWDTVLNPGHPEIYTQDAAGPWILNGSPGQVPGSTLPADCPIWPRGQLTAPNFVLSWSPATMTIPAVPVPAVGRGALALLALFIVAVSVRELRRRGEKCATLS